MAITVTPAASLADSVKEQINSPSTTTASTLMLLRALLGTDAPIDPISGSGSVVLRDATAPAGVACKTSTTAPRTAKSVKSRAATKVVIYTASETYSPLSTDAQRLTLATETFNKTLKSLSNLARSKNGPQAITKCTPCPISSPPRSNKPGNDRPLQETLPNRQPKPLLPQKPKQKLLACTVPPEPNLIITAECARSALDCLRQLEKTGKETQNIQLDRGSLILLETFNLLGLVDLAVQEIRVLRKRLDQRVCACAGTSAYPRGTNDWQRGLPGDSLGEALRFYAVPDSAELCNFIISFQRQVLKTVAILGPSAISQSILETLELRCKHGPCAMILQGYESSLFPAEKAAPYLQALAQAVSALSSIGRSASTKAAGTSLGAEIVLQLQLAGLEIQCRSWITMNAPTDLERGVWAPFIRILAKFCQNSRLAKTEHYGRARDGLQRVKSALKTYSAVEDVCDEPEIPSSVSEYLAKLAQDCGCHTDSIDLLHRSLQTSNDPQSLSSTISRCKIATLRLQAFSDNPRAALGAAEEALSSLKGSIKGSARELEDLLLNGVRLRKTALEMFFKLEKSTNFAPLVDIQVKLRSCAIRILFAFLNFVARYIGGPPLPREAPLVQMEQFHQKVHLARSIAETTISNTISAARSATDDSACTWAEVESALNDCYALAKTLHTVPEPSVVPDKSQTTASTFLKISNVYWLRFLRCKEIKNEPTELLKLLKDSTRMLEDRPKPEQVAGFLAAKYEKMASIYVDLQRDENARNALQRAISNHVSNHGFERAIRHGSSQSMRFSWDCETSAIFSLGKTLAAYVTLVLSSDQLKQHHQEFYDDECLRMEERIALLERQFVICTTLSPSPSKLALVAALAQLILGLYPPTSTLRRLEFLLCIVKFSSLRHNDQIEDLLEKQLTGDNIGDLEDDLKTSPSLSPCAMPLVASLRLQWAFKKDRPSPQLLKDMVDRWTIFVSHCEDWQTVESHLDDPSLLSSQLQAIIDFADMQSLGEMRLKALLLQEKMLESQKRKNDAALARSLVQKGLQCSRLSATADAGRALASARKCIDGMNSDPVVSLQYHLAYAEYLLNISGLEGYVQALEAARLCYAAAFTAANEGVKQHLGLSQTRILCQSAALISRSEFDKGNLVSAVFLAKQGLKLSSQLWAAVQKTQGHVQLRRSQEGNDSTLDSLAEDLTSMNISNTSACERPATRGAAFWPYVSLHCEAFMHLSYLLANCGLYQDAIYYAEQAQHIAEAVNSPVYIRMVRNLLLAHRRKGEDTDAGVQIPNADRPPLEVENTSINVVAASLYLAEASICAGEISAASEAVEEATQFLSKIDSRRAIISDTLESKESPDPPLVSILTGSESKGRGNIAENHSRKTANAKGVRPQGKQSRASAVQSLANGETIPSNTSTRLGSTVNVLKAQIMFSSGNYQDATFQLAMVKGVSLSGPNLLRKRLIETRTILDSVFKSLSADAVHCVLAETTIAFPSLERKEGPSRKQPTLQSPLATRTASRARKPTTADGRKPAHHDTEDDQPPYLVTRAAELLMDAIKSSCGNCPTDLLREAGTMLNQCFVLSSVLLRQRKYSPALVALHAAGPNCSAMTRESSVITADVTLSDKSHVISWPEVVHCDKAINQVTFADASLIEPNFVGNLPEDWNVVSMQLSASQDELSVNKLHAGLPPFSLRIPLRRCSSDGPDEEDFGFAVAKAELLDIIKTANRTAHDSRGQSDRQAKKLWWAEREALDDRLKILLENIENIWLGGFRGIIAHQYRHQDLLSRFSSSLLRSLDQHLPSRQKSRRTIGVESHLHAHVLGLFVALGHPDDHELDDSIADLLYFVVDILQFQGEHNAYDEIDFDIVTMDVLDALRCYHEALKVLDAKYTQHTILILDKELLAFPWESLPCLEGRSVCRMPSLSCVVARLDKIRSQDADASTLSISASKGAYILNPSSDLTSTQSTFEDAFCTALPNYTSIVNRAPTEAEFESCLGEKNLFLYFGHGSGAQYIRGRNIKRLKQCAVTFLMGCSSGKMVECGKFEPYGVPWNYMHAGCPAVVGTLWDVTDKDIDRFAMKTFQDWGLLGHDDTVAEEAAVTGVKRKGKNMKANGKGGVKQTPCQPAPEQKGQKKQNVALDEAVANARSSCVLRYLNGAAPVIYGIPVVLG